MSKLHHWTVSLVKRLGAKTLNRLIGVCYALNFVGFSFIAYTLLGGETHTLAANHLWGFFALAVAVASLIGLFVKEHKWPRILVTAAAGLFFMLGGLTLIGEASGVAISIWLYTGALNLIMVPIFLYMPRDFRTMLELNQQVEDSMADLNDFKDKHHD